MMKTLIAAAVASAFALPALAQSQSNLPNEKERADNRREVSKSAAGAALTTKVKTALARGEGMRTMTDIDVDSADGVVTLKGKVESADAKKKAEAIAKKVDGVKRVKNELRVEKKS
jgi:hyperosmotically inducible periplasmic protein